MRKLLVKEILMALTLKCLLLYALWNICFSHPIEPHLHAFDIQKHVFTLPEHSL